MTKVKEQSSIFRLLNYFPVKEVAESLGKLGKVNLQMDSKLNLMQKTAGVGFTVLSLYQIWFQIMESRQRKLNATAPKSTEMEKKEDQSETDLYEGMSFARKLHIIRHFQERDLQDNSVMIQDNRFEDQLQTKDAMIRDLELQLQNSNTQNDELYLDNRTLRNRESVMTPFKPI